MNILLFLAAIYLIYSAYMFNPIVGALAFIGLLLYGYFRWFPNYCVIHARRIYRKDSEKALKWFARAEKLKMNIGQMEIYAYYLMREGKVEKSEEIYKKLLRAALKPQLRLKIRAEYAVLLSKTGRINEAIEELEDITVHYTNTTTYGSLGYLYLLGDSVRKAKNYNLEAYDYNSDDPVILDNMTQLYIKLGDYKAAKKYADLMLEKKPYFVEAYYDSAFVYMKLGDIKRAKELLEDARCCKITFMSTVKEDDIEELETAISSGKIKELAHRLGKFSGKEEEVEEKVENLPQIEEEKEENDYEDDPFI